MEFNKVFTEQKYNDHQRFLDVKNGGFMLDLSGEDLYEVDFSGANLDRANFSGADLRRANFNNSTLNLTNFTGAKLHNAQLNNLDLSWAKLNEAILIKANLSGSNLMNLSLRNSKLTTSNLKNADLSGARLNNSDLSHANLDGAKLNYSYLKNADLSGADLNKADLDNANLIGVTLNRAKLAGVLNIETTVLPQKFKKDLVYILANSKKNEVKLLKNMLSGGKISGSSYSRSVGCICFLDTLSQSFTSDLTESILIPFYEIGLHNPAEQLFFQIGEGNTPENNQFAAMALEVIDLILAGK